MITATGIAPPREHLELGDAVSYHHRACAARFIRPSEKFREPFWYPVGPGKRDWWGFFLNPEVSDPLENLPTDGSVNKTVVIWPEEGRGVLMGMIRRGIGRSIPHSTSFNGEAYDHDPGYFEVQEWVWLYAVKLSLSSLDLVLTPVWATQRI